MRIDVVTLFPELFPGPLAVGLVGRAIREGRAHVQLVDPRRFTTDRHRSVDGPPYGGGAGMLMRPEPLAAALEVVRGRGEGPIVLLGPRGRPLAQADLARWARGGHLGLVCGRYEGFDERIRGRVDEEISLGDFVLTGGEPAALVIIDGVVRLRPGTLGNAVSAETDSFSDGLLEHPQYTRPECFDGEAVPEVLLGGHHRRIEAWRQASKLTLTRDRRPDLLAARPLPLEARRVLAARPPARRARLAVGLGDRPATAAEVETLTRLAVAWSLEAAWLVGPGAASAVAAAPPIQLRGLPGPRRRDRPEVRALHPAERLRAAEGWAELDGALEPGVVRLVARAPSGALFVTPADARARANVGAGVCVALGPGAEALPGGLDLAPPRQSVGEDALTPLIAAAALLERVWGEG